ncbi:MAG: hypothetical protein U0931_29735 [Vulcanimicrobiota bacterium]
MEVFRAELRIIGVNPYVSVPEEILKRILMDAGRDRGNIPIRGELQGLPYKQTLVRFAGEWRLYVNNKMLKNSPEHVGKVIELSVDFDPQDRSLPLHPKLASALERDALARTNFTSLAPSRQHEINRYLCNLKSEAKVDQNVARAIDYLHGNARFVGRNPPPPAAGRRPPDE